MKLFYIVIIIIISLFALFPSFSLSLLGDDWLAFFRYLQMLGPKSSGEWNHLTYFLTPYGAQDIWMGFLQKIYGYNSTLYFITSYLLRIGAALSLYPLVNYLTKSKLGAMFAVIFFSITVVGFDTTNWSSNMTTYITITFFNIFLYFFIKSRSQGGVKVLSLSLLLYYFAYITAPIRMHGSLVFIFLLEAFWVLQERDLKILKKAFIRFVTIIAVFLIVRYTGHSQGPSQEAIERFNIGIKAMSQMLAAGRFDFLFYPIVMFGSMIIPDLIMPSVQIISKSKLLFTSLIPAFTGFLILSALLLKDIPSSFKLKFFTKTCFAAACWVLIIILIFSKNLATFNDSRYISLLLIGGFGIILIGSLIIKFFKQKNLSSALFLGLSWSILSFFFAWWWAPTSIFPTTYRYLIVSAAGISILFGAIISLGREKKNQLSIFSFLCLFLILHIISTRIYISSLLNTHSQNITNKIWDSIPHVNEIGKSKEPVIFYFEGDNTNGGILHDTVTFGFPPHMGLIYNLMEGDGLPVPISEFKELVSSITDGKNMPAYGYKVKPLAIDRIYAFHLYGKDNLINITSQVREKLRQSKIENESN